MNTTSARAAIRAVCWNATHCVRRTHMLCSLHRLAACRPLHHAVTQQCLFLQGVGALLLPTRPSWLYLQEALSYSCCSYPPSRHQMHDKTQRSQTPSLSQSAHHTHHHTHTAQPAQLPPHSPVSRDSIAACNTLFSAAFHSDPPCDCFLKPATLQAPSSPPLAPVCPTS